MSTTDEQTLSALNAWDIALGAPGPVESLDDYEPEAITAMRSALDAASLDPARLRDGVKAALAKWDEQAQAERPKGIHEMSTALINDLRALLDPQE